jgi:ubiquinone/menaquinone biosynthesis C-methylase UbiE
VAEGWDRYLSEGTAAFARDLVELMELRPGERVLDVGTGSGVTAAEARTVAGPEAAVVGIDPSFEMLRMGRAAMRPVSFVAAEAIDLPFRDQTFHAEMANFVLAHFAKLETGLFDMRRVLKVGGRLGVTAWTNGGDEFSRAWTEVAERHVGREILQDTRARLSPFEERLGRPDDLRDALYRAGFRKIRIERRQHRQDWKREDFVASRNSLRIARFVQQMLGEAGYARFSEDLRTTFEQRFPERLGDTNQALIAIGLRED